MLGQSNSNSWEFLESTKCSNITPVECITSFDVASLFMCTPLDFMRETIVNLGLVAEMGLTD